MMTFDEAFIAVMTFKGADPERALKDYMETRVNRMIPTVEEVLEHRGIAAFVTGIMQQSNLCELAQVIALAFAHGVLVGMKMEESNFNETK